MKYRVGQDMPYAKASRNKKKMFRFIDSFLDVGERYVPTSTVFEKLDAASIVNYMFSHEFAVGKVVLDTGCGYGYGCGYLAQVATYAVGIDINSRAVKFGKRNFAKSNTDFVVADATHLPFRDDCFTVVVSFEVIEHLSNNEKFLSETWRTLNGNGVMITSSPNKRISSPNREIPINPYHVKEFYPHELRELFEKNFDSVRVLGKRIINKDYLQATSKDGWKRIIVKMTTKMQSNILGMLIIAAIPIRMRLWVNKRTLPSLKPSDFEISNQNVDEADTIFVVAEKPKAKPGSIIATVT